MQAACLLAALTLHRAWEVAEASVDLSGHRMGWLDRARHGLRALDRFAPELEASKWLDSKSRSKGKSSRR